jgi:hypothetical protein
MQRKSSQLSRVSSPLGNTAYPAYALKKGKYFNIEMYLLKILCFGQELSPGREEFGNHLQEEANFHTSYFYSQFLFSSPQILLLTIHF